MKEVGTKGGMVERLTKLQHKHICCEHADDIDDWERSEVRWWLNAIADELDEHAPSEGELDWLRAQAEEE